IVQSANNLIINGALPPLADFTFPIYTDDLKNTFQDWSYTATHNFASTANVRQGTNSIMAVYGGNSYQGVTFTPPLAHLQQVIQHLNSPYLEKQVRTERS